jgi:hypothetical protein
MGLSLINYSSVISAIEFLQPSEQAGQRFDKLFETSREKRGEIESIDEIVEQTRSIV